MPTLAPTASQHPLQLTIRLLALPKHELAALLDRFHQEAVAIGRA